MTVDDAAFLVGPLGALVLMPLAVMTLAFRRPRWGAWVGAPLLVAVVYSWLAYWLYWGRAFDFADGNHQVPDSLEAQKLFWSAATAAFMVALALAAGVSLARPGQKPA